MADNATDRPAHRPQIQGAIWLLGIAVIAWTDSWWPGILVLVAISMVSERLIAAYLDNRAEKSATEQEIAETRELALPESCPNCGGPISAATVKWSGPYTASCPYCGAGVKATPKHVPVAPSE